MSQTKIKFYKREPYRRIIIFGLPLFILLMVLITGLVAKGSQQFSELSQAFVHGHLNFLKSIGGVGQDPILYNGKVFWGEGAFPAILLMPFVAFFNLFHAFFYQGYIQWLLELGVIILVFKLARRLNFSKEDSLILTLGFVLGSVFIGIAMVSSSWFFAQVVTTFLLLLALYEFYSHKRWWLIGIICGLILLTRLTAAPIIIFFGLELLFNKAKGSRKLTSLAELGLPVISAIILVGIYNFLRFHNVFNGGFNYQIISPNSAESRSLGIFNPVHIPTNFYHAFLSAPLEVLRSNTSWTLKFPFIQNNPYGMSIFITSPYLLYLFTRKWKSFSSQARHLIVTILITCLLVFSFYGVGILQFGYRYSLDFLPEVFLLFMIIYRQNNQKISKGMKTLLLGSGMFNFYLLMATTAITSYII